MESKEVQQTRPQPFSPGLGMLVLMLGIWALYYHHSSKIGELNAKIAAAELRISALESRLKAKDQESVLKFK
jgi:hypothetical protein